jgi:hypothetical protein
MPPSSGSMLLTIDLGPFSGEDLAELDRIGH